MSDLEINENNHFIKHSSGDSIKFMQWASPTNQHLNFNSLNPRQYPSSNEPTYANQSKVLHEVGEDGRQYYTEYSQVSAIETGFKKLKTNQIQILKELKKEYEVLRNSSLDSRVYLKKMTSESESNGQSKRSITNSDLQSSFKTKTDRSVQNKMNSKQLRLANLQKKQLQLMLNNSMKRVEDLLHSQIQLKRSLLQLRNKLDKTNVTESEYNAISRKFKESEDALSKHAQDLRRQNEAFKAKVRELSLQIGNLQGLLDVKEIQLRKIEEKHRLTEDELYTERNKYLSLELDLKKSRMEYELLQKSKNDQISFLKRNKFNSEQQRFDEKDYHFKKLQQQLRLKEQKYNMLLTQIGNRGNRQEEKEYNKNLQKLISTLREEKDHSNNQSIAMILGKLTQLHARPDNSLLAEISKLKIQLDAIKRNNFTPQNPSENDSNSNEQRIQELQRIIDQQNIEKMYFMEDIKKITREFNQTKKEKEELLRQIKDLKYVIDKLENENRKYRDQINVIRNIKIDLTESQHQNKNLISKLQHLNLKEMQINNFRDENTKKIGQFRLKEDKYEQEVRLLKRQLHEEEFKIFKSHEEYELKIKLLSTDHANELAKLRQELERTIKNNTIEKNQLINQKVALQKRLLDKNRQLQQSNGQINQNLKEKQAALGSIRLEQNFFLQKEQQRHNAQMNRLLLKIQALNNTNERLTQQLLKYSLFEQEVHELKTLVKANQKVTQGVDHLWQIKEAQYANIHQILTVLK